MAQSAQREPSMEEILASIRRIIEDSDSSRDDNATVGAAADTASVVEVDAFRSELRAGANDALPAKGSTPEAAASSVFAGPGVSRPFSMADIEADLAADRTARRATPQSSAAAALSEVKPPEITAPARLAPSVSEPSGASPRTNPADQATPSRPQDDEAEFDLAISTALEKAALASSRDEGTEGEDRAGSQSADATETSVTGTGGEMVPPRSSIISHQTGRQVAAAFGELSEAFAASRRKSFDEIAEEMMRPMLQDWLDNNLPTLVEKLVREEIERIARGA